MNHVGSILALGALAFIAVAPLGAHAILLSAVPSSNGVVHGTKVQVRLQFNSRIDGKRSKLVLLLPSGVEHALSADQLAPDVLGCDLDDLQPGAYAVRWQVLAEDGHITRGELPFRSQ